MSETKLDTKKLTKICQSAVHFFPKISCSQHGTQELLKLHLNSLIGEFTLPPEKGKNL